ncbi:MAG: hypothetical protein PHC97_01840 [Patescibacteria group bacterium]|nr:hypothetical protein [Patescibacteria group bacterium]
MRKKVYGFPKEMSDAKKKKVILGLSGQWVKVKTTDKAFDCKGKLMGLNPDSNEFIFVGTKLIEGSKDQFILSKTARVSMVTSIEVLARRPRCVLL